MDITETSAEGLNRQFSVHIPRTDIDQAVTTRLTELGKTLKIPGFRPGKVPMGVMRQRYGTSVMGEVLEGLVSNTSREVLNEKGVRPAMQPKIEIKTFEPQGETDLEYSMDVEIMPEITPMDLATLELERMVAVPEEAEVKKALEDLATRKASFVPNTRKKVAAKGDFVRIDFKGTVNGEAREGMSAEDTDLELGAGQFIPGFEDEVIGMRKDEPEKTFKITFPADYHANELAGAEAEFTVTLKDILKRELPEIDDEFAKGFGADDMAALEGMIREQMETELKAVSRQRLKRVLFDKLAEAHDFDVPEGMVDIEFEEVWKGVQKEREHGHLSEEEMAKSDDELKADYRKIAERRVRLGLLLTEIGNKNKLEVTNEELQSAIYQQALRMPGQEQMVIEYFQKNPQALDGLRAPIYEDKVVDYILEIAQISEKEVSVDDLGKDPEEE